MLYNIISWNAMVEIVSSIGSPVDIYAEIILAAAKRFSGYPSIVPCLLLYNTLLCVYICIISDTHSHTRCLRVKPISFFAITVTTI